MEYTPVDAGIWEGAGRAFDLLRIPTTCSKCQWEGSTLYGLSYLRPRPHHAFSRHISCDLDLSTIRFEGLLI